MQTDKDLIKGVSSSEMGSMVWSPMLFKLLPQGDEGKKIQKAIG
jgi:hypothetical protein